MRWQWRATLAAAGAAAIVLGYLWLRPQRIRITEAAVERGEIVNTITTNGRVEAAQNFEAHALTSGVVRRVLVAEGQKVASGQLLAEMDAEAARAQLAQARAELKGAEAEQARVRQGGGRDELLGRHADLEKARLELASAEKSLASAERLLAQGAASRQEVDAARRRRDAAQAAVRPLAASSTERYSELDKAQAAERVRQAQASVASAQKAVASVEIRAPFAGVVYGVAARPSAYVNAGDLLLQVGDMRRLQVRAYVDEPDMARLAEGQAMQYVWEASPQKSWRGAVRQLPLTVTARGSRMVGELLGSLDGATAPPPGANVTVAIETARRDGALCLPRGVVHAEGGVSYVWLRRGRRLIRQTVRTGVFNLTRVEVLEGLQEGDRVAVDSQSPRPLSEGVDVIVVDAPK